MYFVVKGIHCLQNKSISAANASSFWYFAPFDILVIFPCVINSKSAVLTVAVLTVYQFYRLLLSVPCQNRDWQNWDKLTLIAENICTVTVKKIEGSQNTLKCTTFFADTRHTGSREFSCLPRIMLGDSPEILDLRYVIQPDTDHVTKLHGD